MDTTTLTKNSALKSAALTSLKGKWSLVVAATLIYMVIYCTVASPYSIGGFLKNNILIGVGFFGILFIGLPLLYGYLVYLLRIYRGETLEIGSLFSGFQSYSTVFFTMTLMNIYIALWTVLLIIPGIIKTYSYAMTPYIMYDKPELGANATIEESMAMMKGHKMKLFLLDLSFLGWWLLSILTLGIGFLWLTPYMSSARAAFYEDIKAKRA